MMAIIKFMARQRDHLVPTLVCTIEFMLGTACLIVNVSNFLATLFWQLLSLALVSMTIHITRFLLPIGMQKCPSVSTRNIFQNNLHIVMRSSLSCPPAGIRHNLHITVRSSLSYPLIGICRMLLLRLSSVPFLGNTISKDVQVLQRGLLFLFIHWINEGYCVEGGGDR
jgi:hypothetical protein